MTSIALGKWQIYKRDKSFRRHRYKQAVLDQQNYRAAFQRAVLQTWMPGACVMDHSVGSGQKATNSIYSIRSVGTVLLSAEDNTPTPNINIHNANSNGRNNPLGPRFTSTYELHPHPISKQAYGLSF
jgi:hypothetical protein